MKKILHVAEPFATGVLSFLMDITRRQVEEYEIYILWGRRPLTPANVESLFDHRVKLICIDSFKGALGTVANPKAYRDVRRWYKKINPDIVHFHSSASGFVGRWAIPVGNVPAFYTPHGYSFLMQDGGKMKRIVYWLIEYLSAKRNCQTIACSEGEYKEALKLSENATYVNNGIRVDELDEALAKQRIPRAGHDVKRWKACTSGRVLYQKNPKLFNEVALLLPEVEFTWIGEGELKTELTAPNVKVTGWVTREECLRIVGEADFFLLPSLWEGLPISLLEAMYMKKVCLVSNVIGNRDVIHDEVNGYICNEANDYTERIRKIISGKTDGASLGLEARNDVEKHYNVEIMAKEYSKIYNNSIKE